MVSSVVSTRVATRHARQASQTMQATQQETCFSEGQQQQQQKQQQHHQQQHLQRTKNGSQRGTEPAAQAVGLEEALELTGYGKFNYMLLLGVWLGMTTQNFTSSDISYALPAAECDLQLTPMVKGWINSAMYLGMLFTAFVWGALSDWLGRKWLMMLAFLCMAANSAATALVTTSWAFLLCRVVSGMLLIGPGSMALTYAGEMFSPAYRGKMFMWAGGLQAVSAAVHAGLAMWIIPLPLTWMRSWRVFLLMTAVANTAAGLYMLLLPESPKYLAARGRQRESISVLSAIYAANTGRPPDTYPVRSLSIKPSSVPESRNPCVTIGRQFVKLCRKPYRTPLLFVLAMQPLILLSQNTVRMWVPQIFAEMERDLASGMEASRDVCSILEAGPRRAVNGSLPMTMPDPEDCGTYTVDASVYLNSVIIALARAGMQLSTSIFVRPGGQLVTLVLSLLLAACVLFVWPWAPSATVVLALACVYEGSGNVAFSTILNITVELFPTSVRTSAVSLAAFAGRAGSMVGNMIYPVMFIIHCSSAFWIGSACFVVAAVVGAFRPKPAFTPTPSTGLAKALAEKKSQPPQRSEPEKY